MNTAIKGIIALVVVLALIAAWMYFSGSQIMTPGGSADNQSVTPPPAATGSLDDLDAAINADANQTSSLSSGDDSDAAAASGNTSASGAANAVGSY
jgi:hypothetical protein